MCSHSRSEIDQGPDGRGHPNSDAGRRTLTVPTALMELLAHHLRRRQVTAADTEAYIFVGKQGRLLQHSGSVSGCGNPLARKSGSRTSDSMTCEGRTAGRRNSNQRPQRPEPYSGVFGAVRGTVTDRMRCSGHDLVVWWSAVESPGLRRTRDRRGMIRAWLGCQSICKRRTASVVGLRDTIAPAARSSLTCGRFSTRRPRCRTGGALRFLADVRPKVGLPRTGRVTHRSRGPLSRAHTVRQRQRRGWQRRPHAAIRRRWHERPRDRVRSTRLARRREVGVKEQLHAE